jgi:hypothetical protein
MIQIPHTVKLQVATSLMQYFRNSVLSDRRGRNQCDFQEETTQSNDPKMP